jgi:multicomponent Na+:H+ antiporter subunit E
MVLFVPWLVLSGKFDPLHVGMGIVCSLLVAYWSADLLFQDREATLGDRLRQLAGFAGYTGWMFGQIVRANLHVFRVAFSPQMHELLAPRMVEFET